MQRYEEHPLLRSQLHFLHIEQLILPPFCDVPRYIIDHSAGAAQLYPCQQDEWIRMTFADYSVPIQDTANSWVLLFRLDNVVGKTEMWCCLIF